LISLGSFEFDRVVTNVVAFLFQFLGIAYDVFKVIALPEASRAFHVVGLDMTKPDNGGE